MSMTVCDPSRSSASERRGTDLAQPALRAWGHKRDATTVAKRRLWWPWCCSLARPTPCGPCPSGHIAVRARVLRCARASLEKARYVAILTTYLLDPRLLHLQAWQAARAGEPERAVHRLPHGSRHSSNQCANSDSLKYKSRVRLKSSRSCLELYGRMAMRLMARSGGLMAHLRQCDRASSRG